MTNRNMTTTKPFALGSVSTGTLRTEDLLPPLINKLRQFNPDHHLVQEYDVSALNDSDAEIMGQLSEALQEHSPPFVYFGAHPDEVADFGFWPDWDALEKAVHGLRYPITSKGVYRLESEQVILEFDGRSNVTVMDLDRRILWTTV